MNYIFSALTKLSKLLSRKNLYPWLRGHVAFASQGGPIKVLNIGASGPIPDLLTGMPGIQLCCLDINPDKKPDIVCDATDMQGVIDDNTYDAVVLMEVLEHIPEPAKALAEIRRILKPDGILLGSTPFLFPIHDAPHDYYRYTIYGLTHLLRGYANVRIDPRNSFGEAIAVLLSRLAVTGSKKERLIGIFAMVFALALYPFLWLMGRICHQNLGPTGYVWSAKK